MTTNIVSELANKWLPFPPERFFTDQRAPDMWFGDELPPTWQAELASPIVQQSKMMLSFQLQQQLALGERQRIARAEMKRRKAAIARVGGKRRGKH